MAWQLDSIQAEGKKAFTLMKQTLERGFAIHGSSQCLESFNFRNYICSCLHDAVRRGTCEVSFPPELGKFAAEPAALLKYEQ